MSDSLSNAQILAILQALVKDKSCVMHIKNNKFYINGQCFGTATVPFSEAGIKSRIERFAKRLGFPNADLQALRYAWGHLLIQDSPVSSQALLEAAQNSAIHQFDASDNLIQAWRAAIEKRLHEVCPTLPCVDKFDIQPDQATYAKTLELNALLEHWPNRLLNDKAWACTEPPLPEIEPMPLDSVWVDIQFIDPRETGNITLSKDLLQSLELRYEERQWLSEPAQFILEKLRGSVALIGMPGIGKTTLLKWLAQQLIIAAEGRFLLPLFVPLRKYAVAKSANVDLLGFAIHECGITHPDQIALWENTLSYLSGTARNTVLFMLDGWDEVPPDNREILLNEIKALMQGFAVLITSRPSAYPLSLPADHFYEITELSPESISSLIYRWFKAAQLPEHADLLLQHLDNHPDLRRLARNPFLLNLLCGISYQTGKNIKSNFNTLPTSRTALYQHTITHIKRHHSQRYPTAPFDKVRQRQVEQLALWLIAEVADAPRYVFNSYDVVEHCGDNTLLPNVLQPSRLISQWSVDEESLHFIHTTFHEYMAACGLLHGKTANITSLIHEHAYDTAWQEIFRFLAGGHGDIRQVFWQEMRQLAQNPDRFGLIYVRLAYFVAETRTPAGGDNLLGIDLREQLWTCICAGIEINIFVDAYLELDMADYVRRVKAFSHDNNERLKATLLRTLDRAKTVESSNILLQKLLFGDEKAAAVASYAAAATLNSEDIKTLRGILSDAERPSHTRRWIIRTLGHVRDYTSVSQLIAIVQHDDIYASDALRALGRIGGQTASAALMEILSQTDELTQKEAVIDALGFMRDAVARNTLLDELASLNSLDDPLAEAILNALCEKPIPQQSQVIIDFLQHSQDEAIRAAAAWALLEATEAGVTETLAQVAQQDSSEKVRIAALAALRKQARPSDALWLAKRVRDVGCALVERANALEAILMMTVQYWHHAYGTRQLKDLAEELALLALNKPAKDLTYAAAARGHLLGETLAPRLMAISVDGQFPYDVREAACVSLGKLKYHDAIDVLLELVRREPNTPDDEDIPLTNLNQRIARTAAESLCQIDASILLDEPGQTAYNALARFSIRTGHLIFSNHIKNANGRVIFMKQQENTDELSQVEEAEKNADKPVISTVSQANPNEFVTTEKSAPEEPKNYFLQPILLAGMALIIIFVGLFALFKEENSIEKYQQNVLALTASFEDGTNQHGFGFVVGESEVKNELYVITANHVVRTYSEDSDELINATQVSAKFFKNQGAEPEPATLLNVLDTRLDLALLSVQKPYLYQWEKRYFCAEHNRNDEVWFIGRNEEWPILQAGRIIKPEDIDGFIHADIPGIEVGTSGAPLISNNGIIGIIVDDGGYQIRATAIELVQKLVTGKNYPWQLQDCKAKKNNILLVILIGMPLVLLPFIIAFFYQRKRDPKSEQESTTTPFNTSITEQKIETDNLKSEYNSKNQTNQSVNTMESNLELMQQKLNSLEKALILETDASVKFKLENEIAELQQEIARKKC